MGLTQVAAIYPKKIYFEVFQSFFKVISVDFLWGDTGIVFIMKRRALKRFVVLRGVFVSRHNATSLYDCISRASYGTILPLVILADIIGW